MADVPRDYKKQDSSFCAHCGTEVSNAGRPGKNGKRYCQAKGCRAAKARADRKHAAMFKPQREAPTSCANCGAALPRRDWRSSDELGRWCHRARCVTARDTARSAAQVDTVVALQKQLELNDTRIALLEDAVMADAEDCMTAGRIVCRQCGLTTALQGWVHPTETFSVCEGTLNGQASRNIGRLGVAGAWPFKREYIPADQLAEAYAD